MADLKPSCRVTPEQLEEIVRRLVDALSPRRIIFFGSHAYGQPHPDSDIDLMILFEDDEADRFEFIKKAYAAVRHVDSPVELHFRPAAKFDRWATVPASFEHEIAKKGRRVYVAEN